MVNSPSWNMNQEELNLLAKTVVEVEGSIDYKGNRAPFVVRYLDCYKFKLNNEYVSGGIWYSLSDFRYNIYVTNVDTHATLTHELSHIIHAVFYPWLVHGEAAACMLQNRDFSDLILNTANDVFHKLGTSTRATLYIIPHPLRFLIHKENVI